MAQRITFRQILGLFSNRQNDTSNNADPTDQRIEYGWGVIVSGTTNNPSETVTFRQAFNSIPVVLITHAGDAASAVGYGSGNLSIKAAYMLVGAISTTGFSAIARTTDATTYPNATNIYYTWIAIGN